MYSCDREGNIYSYKSGKRKKRKLTKDSYGYYILVLMKHGDRNHVKAHRMIAKTFIPNPDSKGTVNHKDCNKLNNNVNNLEWMSFSENSIHGYKNNRFKTYGENHHKSKLTEHDVLDIINAYRAFDCINTRDLATAYDMHPSSICGIIRGDTWKHIQP